MAKSARPPVRFGKPEDRPKSDGKSGSFLSIPKDKIMTLKILVPASEIPSVDQCALWNYFNPSPVWTYIGADDPSIDLGIKHGYRAFVPVSFKDDEGELKVKLWSVPLGVHKQLGEMDEMAGSLKGQEIRVKKIGSGLKTKYSIVSTGRRIKITEKVPTQEEILDLLGPYTREEIIKVIEERCEMDWDEIVAVVASKTSGVPVPKKKKKGPSFETIEVDDEEFVSEEEELEDDSFSDDEIEETPKNNKKPVSPKPASSGVKSPAAKEKKPVPPPVKKTPAPTISVDDDEVDGVDADGDEYWAEVADDEEEGDIV